MVKRTYMKADTIGQALDMAGQTCGNHIYSAGGTDLQINRKQELMQKPAIIDLSNIAELKGIKTDNQALMIGSMVTLEELIRSSIVSNWCGLVTEAAQSIATPVIRMTATVGGNLLVSNRCTYYNQSLHWRETVGSCLRDTGDTCLAIGGGDKCFSRNVSDLAPALIALDAQIIVHNARGIREIALADLYASDGIRYHAGLEAESILTTVRIPHPPSRWWYRKLRRRESIDYSSLTIAAATFAASRARICVNGVSMAPILLEADLNAQSPEELSKQARQKANIVDNDLLPMTYRREMMTVYFQDLWRDLAGSCGST